MSTKKASSWSSKRIKCALSTLTFAFLTFAIFVTGIEANKHDDNNFMINIGAQTYTNPVENENHPDPGALPLPSGDGYVVVSTSDLAKSNKEPIFPIMYSADMVNWDHLGHVFMGWNAPAWASSDFWAPEIHYFSNNYYVYFSARHKETKRLCIGVAISPEPFGPFIEYGKPIIEHPDGVIDITWFQDPKDGQMYLIWKRDSNAEGRTSRILIRKVLPDGVTFEPNHHDITLVKADPTTEGLVIEGPWMIYREPYYYLLYSGDGGRSEFYHVGVARSKSVTGPFDKLDREILHLDKAAYTAGKNCTFTGPGHGSVVRTGTGEDWFIYHAYKWHQTGQNPPGRVLMLDRIRWDVIPGGWPYIGTPSNKPQLRPN